MGDAQELDGEHVRENPNLKWMMKWGYPYSRKPPYYHLFVAIIIVIIIITHIIVIITIFIIIFITITISLLLLLLSYHMYIYIYVHFTEDCIRIFRIQGVRGR